MIKNWKLKLVFILVFASFSMHMLKAQVMLQELSFQDQISHSSLVVEGKVVGKKSFWDSGKKNIYTVNTIEVYKVFKGKEVQKVDIVTKGGQVGMHAQFVSPNLSLKEGKVGLFTLHQTGIPKLSGTKSNILKFKVYGGLQGYYKYNLYDDVVLNPFNGWQGISTVFYDIVLKTTKQAFKTISPFNAKKETAKLSNAKSALAPSDIAFSPTTTTAGTKSTITITLANGATGDFGSEKGTVSFRNADTGGVKLENGNPVPDFIDALDTQILSWSSSSITVEVPSNAGTGSIRVTDASFNVVESAADSMLEITYSVINEVFEEAQGSNLVKFAVATRLVNNDRSGGYILHMEESFDADLEHTGAKDAFNVALDTWRCETGVNFTIGEVTNVDEVKRDGVNVIRFDNGSELDEGTLGTTSHFYSGCGAVSDPNFEIIVSEVDVVFNDDIDWYFGGNSPGAQVDFESVALHEIGHAHLLGHVIDDIDDVMHFSFSRGEQLRVLSDHNRQGAKQIMDRSLRPYPCFASKSAMENYECPLSVEDVLFRDSITIFPNPANDSFFVKKSNFVNLESMELYDIKGRLIQIFDLNDEINQKPFNISGLLGGVYLLKIKEAQTGDFLTKRLIVK